LLTTPPPSVFLPLSLHDALPIWGGPAVRVIVSNGENHGVSGLPATRAGSASKGPTCAGASGPCPVALRPARPRPPGRHSRSTARSEEHTSELQSRFDLVCRLLLE